MTVEVEGNGPVVAKSGQTVPVVGVDLDGDGFVSTKQTGPIQGEQPTIDVPDQDCSRAVWPDFTGDGVMDRAVFHDGAWFVEGGATRFLGQAGDVSGPGVVTVTAPRSVRCTTRRMGVCAGRAHRVLRPRY